MKSINFTRKPCAGHPVRDLIHKTYNQKALKGTVHHKMPIFPLTCSAISQSNLFCFGDISRRDLCLSSNIMGLNVLLTVPKNTLENLNSNVSLQKS